MLLSAGAMVQRLNHQCWLAPLGPGITKSVFGLSLSRIKRPQVMSMVKYSPRALNFGYDFVLLVHFFGTLWSYFNDFEMQNHSVI